MDILITGAAGFVGKNLTAALECIRDGKDRTHPGAVLYVQLTIDCIYDTFFISCPQGRNKTFLWPVTGEAVDAYAFRQALNAAGEQAEVFLPLQRLELSRLVADNGAGRTGNSL